jgi:hypothetical protein
VDAESKDTGDENKSDYRDNNKDSGNTTEEKEIK